MKEQLKKLYQATELENKRVILNLLETDESARVLDLGCGDGSFTVELGKKVATTELHGIEIDEESIQQCEAKGITAYRADLNEPMPLDSDSSDVVCASQVLEHLHHTDLFIKEIYRILKGGGYALISTPNLASAYNILCLVLGWQPLTCFVSDEVYDLANPFGLRRGVKREAAGSGHLRVPTCRRLKELFEYHGYEVEKTVGVGYYALPVKIAKFFACLDRRHAAYLAMKARNVEW